MTKMELETWAPTCGRLGVVKQVNNCRRCRVRGMHVRKCWNVHRIGRSRVRYERPGTSLVHTSAEENGEATYGQLVRPVGLCLHSCSGVAYHESSSAWRR